MRKRILSFAIIITFSLCPFIVHAEAAAVTAPVINIKYPEWTNKDVAVVNVIVDPLPDYLLARPDSQKDFTDITYDSNYKIKENGVIYIKAVYATEGVTQEFTRSFVIECFDRKTPTFSALLNGTKLTITAKDDVSGINAIYVNEDVITEFNALTNLTASAVYKVSSKDSSVTVFVEDNAGNLSSVQTISVNTSNNSGSGSSSGSGRIGNANITLEKPDWNNKKSAYIKVKVSGQNIDSVEAKTSRSADWKYIDENMDFKITDNTDVYVRATNTDGVATTYSEHIECFDRTPPSINVTQDGKNLNVVTVDNQSGTELIFINGKAYKTSDGTAGVSIPQNAKYMTVQTKDFAGNYSAIETVTVNQSLLGNTDNAVSNSPPPPGVDVMEETQAGTVYNITLDGENYSIEELQSMGVPIYIITGIDEQTLKGIIQEVYLSQSNNEITAYELPAGDIALSETQEEDPIQTETSEIQEPPSTEKNKSSPVGIAIVGAAIIVLGLIAFLYMKRHTAKYSKDDLYESEYDPDRNAYGDDYEDMDNPLELDIAY